MKQIMELVSVKENSDGHTLFSKPNTNGVNTNLNNSFGLIMHLTDHSSQVLASTYFYSENWNQIYLWTIKFLHSMFSCV